MICTGVLTLGAVVRFDRATDGAPQLLMHAFAPGLSANGVAYKLIWTGPQAEAFYTLNEHRLYVGTDLSVTAINAQPLVQDGQSYILASVLGIEIVKRSSEPVASVGGHYTPRPVMKSRWVDLPGVAA
jgi:hypothetical protein